MAGLQLYRGEQTQEDVNVMLTGLSVVSERFSSRLSIEQLLTVQVPYLIFQSLYDINL